MWWSIIMHLLVMIVLEYWDLWFLLVYTIWILKLVLGNIQCWEPSFDTYLVSSTSRLFNSYFICIPLLEKIPQVLWMQRVEDIPEVLIGRGIVIRSFIRKVQMEFWEDLASISIFWAQTLHRSLIPHLWKFAKNWIPDQLLFWELAYFSLTIQNSFKEVHAWASERRKVKTTWAVINSLTVLTKYLIKLSFGAELWLELVNRYIDKFRMIFHL